MKKSELREIIREELINILEGYHDPFEDEEDGEEASLDFINKLAKKDITLLKPSEYKRYARQTKMPK